MIKIKRSFTWKRLAWFLLSGWCILLGGLTWDGLTDELATVDLAIVLGNTVDRTGQPSLRLKSRLDRAVTLYQEHWFNRILVSGGRGKEGFNEAAVMAQYLIGHGVPKAAIIQDPQGINTWMTAQNTVKLVHPNQRRTVMVISQFFHISRTRLAFKKAGFAKVYAAHAHYFELRDLYSLGREVFGYARYLFKSSDLRNALR